MSQSLRFGRRLAIPSTRQIIHEMRMLEAGEKRLKAALLPAVQPSESKDHDVRHLAEVGNAGS